MTDANVNDQLVKLRLHPCARCEDCSLYSFAQNGVGGYVPTKFVEGSSVMFVGEAPGREEVEQGEPFVGQAGKLLGRAIISAGADPSKVSKTNVVACRPPGNELAPYADAIEACRPRLIDDLQKFEGEKVVALGRYAADTIIGDLAGKQDVAALPPSARRARWFEAAASSVLKGKRVLTEYHPAYVARKPAEMPGFKKGIARVFSNASDALLKPPEVVVLQEFEDVERVLSRVPDGTWLAFDLETNQVQWFDRPDEPGDTILMIALAWNLKKGYIIPGDMLYDEPRLVPYLNQFFDRVKTIAHNGKFDVVFLKTVGVRAHVDFDTMLAHFVLEETAAHGLKAIAQDEYGIPDYEAEIIAQYLKNSNDWYSKIPFDKLAQYAAWDVIVTRALKERFEKRLKNRPSFKNEYQEVATREEVRDASLHEWPYMNLLMPAQGFLSGVEFRGTGVDVPYLQRASKAMEEELEEHCQHLRELCGRPGFNPNSPIQVAEVLYDQRKLPNPKELARALGRRIDKAKSKNPLRATNAGILDALAEVTGDEFVKDLKAYRRVAKIKSSYIDNMIEYADTRGRVHADQRVMGTEVGRLAVRNPALQTIPRPRDRHGAAIRGAFIATPYEYEEVRRYVTPGSFAETLWKMLGTPMPDLLTLTDEDCEAVLVIADYSQAELRCAAHYSNEPFLIKVYQDDRDLHDEGTLGMYGTVEHLAETRGLTLEDAKVLWKELRVQVKMFNFAYLYGGNENSFAQDTGIPMAEAKAFVRRYEANMPVLAQWRKLQYKRALRNGYVVTVHGRRRSFPELQALSHETLHDSDNKKLLDDIGKASVHAVVAGTASDLCLLSANELSSWGLEIELLVHDSIITRAPRFVARHLESRIPEVMVNTASYWLPRVAWKADVKVDKRWAKPPADLLKAA